MSHDFQITRILNTNPTSISTEPLKYGSELPRSKARPAQIGPRIRPRLMKELLRPMAAPCSSPALLEISARAAGRSRVLERMKNPVAARMVGKSQAASNTRKPADPASREALMVAPSPQRRVTGPVRAALPMVETTATTIRITPTRSGP